MLRTALRRLAATAAWPLAPLAAMASFVASPVEAQPAQAAVDLVLRGVPADEALAALADAAGINVVYSTALVGETRVWCGRPGWRAEDLLRCITDAAGLDYVRRSSGTYVVTERVVEPVPPGAVAGLVVDAETGEPLPLAHVRIGAPAALDVTDTDGHFAVGELPPGAYVLTASYVGYLPAAVRVSVSSGRVSPARIELPLAVARIGAVVVDGLQARLASEALGADSDFEVLTDRAAGRARSPDRLPDLAEGAPAPTSSVDGAALRLLLGVAERTFRDGLSLQGGEMGEHALQIDGATVYEPLAVGPALGALSPLAVGRVTVRKAGFGARHGSLLAGVVQARHALSRPESGAPLAASAEADLYAAGGRLQHHARVGTVGGEPLEATTMLAARRGLWDVAAPPALNRAVRAWNDVDPVLAGALTGTAPRPRFDVHRHGSDVAFSDLHAATRWRAGQLRTLGASVYHGSAAVATELFAQGAPPAGATPAASDPEALLLARDATRWTNLAATIRGDALVSARWRVGAGARLSRHTLRQRYDAIDGAEAGLDGTEATADAEARLGAALDGLEIGDNGNDLTELAVDLDADVTVAPGHEVSLGLESAAAKNRFHLLSDGFGSAAFRDLDAGHTQVRLAAYAEGRHRLGSRWTLEPSLRITSLASSGDVFAEPRVTLRFDAAEGDRAGVVPLRGLAARLAAGVYRQFVSRVELDTFGPSALVPSIAVWLPADGSVPLPSAFHLAGEVLWQPSAAWSARVEGYAKALPRVYALDYAALVTSDTLADPPLATQTDFLLPQEGRLVGVGVRVERQAPRWAASAGLAVARTQRRSDDRFGGRWVQAPWAEPVRATLGLDVLAAGRRGGTGLLLRARGLGVWGRAWAFRHAYYDVLPIFAGTTRLGGFALDRPESDRLPPLITVDLGVAYTRELAGGRRVEVAFDVDNVLDRSNALDWSLRPDADGVLVPYTRALPGIQPSLRLRVTV